ncbi:MAG: hypothetical protein ACKE51_08930, partial [Methylococcaceae bacterium]
WFLTPCGQKNGALRLCLANFEMASTQSESTFCGPRSALCFSVQALGRHSLNRITCLTSTVSRYNSII